MPLDTHKYTNGEVTIVWKPDVCIHSGICVKGLPLVFNARRSPWIDPMAADTPSLITQVKKCPSGALSFIMNESDRGRAAEDAARDAEE